MGLFGGKTFTPATDIPNISGKVFLVTGGNAGLGYEAITQIAAHNPQAIYLAARTPSKGEAAVTELKKTNPKTDIIYLPLDLSSFASISAAAKEFQSKSNRLDCLMNNAGIMAVPAAETKEGYELQFGTNYMGHALLTKLLMPTLRATAQEPGADVRIVNLTSEAHKFWNLPSIQLDQEKLKPLGPWAKYGHSKLANILFTRSLAETYPEITSVAIHPGIIKTDLYLPNQQASLITRMGLAIMGSFRGTVATGALNQLWAATGKEDELESGAYYRPIASKSGGSSCAQNMELAKQLRDWTEKEFAAKGY
ncbi:MAG: hypothetical protein Q9217_005412 [Psora testacea]